MRNLIIVVVLAAIVALGLDVSRGPAAPALPDKPIKFEYAELTGRVPLAGTWPAAMAAPAPRQVGPGALPLAAAPGLLLRWTTADDEIEVADWQELANKLKAPAAKKEGSMTMHRLRVMNRLSEEGWEVYERTSTHNWTFRRRVQ